MQTRRALLFVGSLWELARFFLIISILAIVLRALTPESFAVVPWLLLVGTGNLLLPVGCLLLSVYPARYGNLIGLLRLGKGLGVFAFLLLALSSGFSMIAGSILIRVGGFAVTRAVAMLAIFTVDLAFLAALLFYPGEGGSGATETAGVANGKASLW